MNSDRRILVVEDEALVLNVVTKCLNSLGFEAQGVDSFDSAEACLTAPGNLPAIAIVDIHLGHQNGLDLLRRFRHLVPEVEFLIMSGDHSPQFPVQAMREGASGYLLKPITVDTLRHEVERVWRLRRALLMEREEHSQLQTDLEIRTRQFLKESGTRHTLERNLILSLCRLAEYRDNETGKHLHRMAQYSLHLARALNTFPEFAEVIDTRYLRRLQLAAPLHDIGKAGIPDAVLQKPGAFTPEEMAVMRTHCRIGYDILEEALHGLDEEDAGMIHMGMEICRSHHERWDGSGYPDGLAAEAIPLVARIAALADVYDALSMPRVYRRNVMSHDELRAMILKESGRHFDPQVVAAFLVAEEHFVATRVEMAD